jgi:hypothetical protein
MHHTRKKKAITLIGEEKDPIIITKLLLDNQFTDEEVSEIIGSLSEGSASPADETAPVTSPAHSNESTANGTKPPPPLPVLPGRQSKYRQYDLWQVEIVRREITDPITRQRMVVIESFTAIKPIRKGVKLEEQVVRDMNAQSHNSLRRYYLSGSITNGNTEKVDITTASTDAK